jgi:hypothetical protein
MKLLSTLSNGPTLFTGHGINHEGENFLGRMEILTLVGGKGVLLHYTATGNDGKHLHEESTLLSTNDQQVLCLWPVMEELPFVLAHPKISTATRDDGTFVAVFASGPRTAKDVFREEISIELGEDASLCYAHAWGMPGGNFEARSRCQLTPKDS